MSMSVRNSGQIRKTDMSNESANIIQRLWNYCNILRDNKIEKELDGVLPCGDDMVRAERLRGSVLKSAFEDRLV